MYAAVNGTRIYYEIIGKGRPLSMVHHLALLKNACFFQNAIRQGGFAMVDMGDNAKIADTVQTVFHGMLPP